MNGVNIEFFSMYFLFSLLLKPFVSDAQGTLLMFFFECLYVKVHGNASNLNLNLLRSKL